jgi:hypothetical protein
MIKAQSAPASASIRYGLTAMRHPDFAFVRGWLAQPHARRWHRVRERNTAWGHVLLMRCDNLKPIISP